MDPPNLDPLHLSDSDSDAALFDTPAPRKHDDDNQDRASSTTTTNAAKQRAKESHYTAEEAREAALKRELANVRNVNQVIEGVVESLQKAKDNMDTVSKTVHNASTLLQTWSRILSQTEHNQRLILNPQWQGASQDLVDLRDEEVMRAQEAERRAYDEQNRREAAARKIEEDRRRAEASTKAPRGRGRGTKTRGTSSSSSGHVVVGGQGGRGLARSGSTSSRGTSGSGIGRGLRGRGRGLG